MAGVKLTKYTTGFATNYLQYSQDFALTVWNSVDAVVTDNDTTAPDATTTAAKALASSTTFELVQATLTNVPSGSLTASIYVKKGGTSAGFFYLEIGNAVSGCFCWFDLNTGAVGTSGNYGSGFTVGTPTISNEGSGWYRCVMPLTAGTENSQFYMIPVTDGDNDPFSTINDYNYIWGAQLETGSSATTYEKTPLSWTKDANCQMAHLILVGGGGGGGGGNALNADTSGGGGGGGAGIIDIWLGADELGATEDYVVAVQAAGGIAAGDGEAGKTTSFTINSGGTTLTAYGGGGAGNGVSGSTSGGGGGAGRNSAGANATGTSGAAGGTNGGVNGGSGTAGSSNTSFGCGGGGGGGEDSAGEEGVNVGGNAIFGGGGGGAGACRLTSGPDYQDGSAGGGTHLAGGVGGLNTGPVAAGAGVSGIARPGSGGGGGYAHATVAGDGGAGGVPGGGGGGGGSTALSQTAGSGGVGARGEIWVIEYLNDPSSHSASFGMGF